MGITEGIRKIFLAGVGAVATTGEAAKGLIDTLAEKGELTVEQGKSLNEELKKSAKEKMNRHVTVHVVNEFRDVYSAVDKMTEEELESLKERLNELTARKAAGPEEMSPEAPADPASPEGAEDPASPEGAGDATSPEGAGDAEESPDNTAES